MSSKPVPPRGRSLFRQANRVKAMRSAKAAGLEIGGVEVAPDGTIRVLSRGATEHGSDLDTWLSQREGDARQA
jgi:acylphosphatase